MQISLEALKQMKDAGLTKPDFVSEQEWLACDCEDEITNLPAIAETQAPTATPVQFIPQALTLDDLDQNGMAVDMMMKIKTGSVFLVFLNTFAYNLFTVFCLSIFFSIFGHYTFSIC